MTPNLNQAVSRNCLIFLIYILKKEFSGAILVISHKVGESIMFVSAAQFYYFNYYFTLKK